MTRFHRAKPLWLAVLLMLLVVPTVAAATIASEDEYVLPAGEVVEGNLYAFGSTVTIKGTVRGDLVTAAQEVEISPTGIVESDVLAAGQSVVVRGTVEDDVRAAGFTIEVEDNAAVGGDLVGAGYNISTAVDSIVQGSFIAAGTQAILDGDVVGDVRFAGSGLDIEGSVSGDVEADVAERSDGGAPTMFMFGVAPPRSVDPGLTLGDEARIGGDLILTTPDTDVEIDDGAVGGSIDVQEPDTDEDDDADEDEDADEEDEDEDAVDEAIDWGIGFVKRYASLFLLGLVLLWVRPTAVLQAADVLAARKLPSLGWGFVTVAAALVLSILIPLVAIAVAAFVGLIQLTPLVAPTLAGGALLWSIVVLGTYLLTWLARIVFAVWTARAIFRRLAPNIAGNRLALLLVGLLIYVVLVSIPYLGWLFKIAFILLGIGALEVHSWLNWLTRHDNGSTTPIDA